MLKQVRSGKFSLGQVRSCWSRIGYFGLDKACYDSLSRVMSC
jgi:hypothetical protein